jgi:hypothetical protein
MFPLFKRGHGEAEGILFSVKILLLSELLLLSKGG